MKSIDNYKKILLVDDDIDLLEQNKILFESLGLNIITADSAKDGLIQFMKELPDAAIIDLIMERPDSGFVLSHKIKNTEHGRKIPVLILSSATYDTGIKFGTTTPEEKAWIKCDGFLNKPVVIEELISKLEKFVN